MKDNFLNEEAQVLIVDSTKIAKPLVRSIICFLAELESNRSDDKGYDDRLLRLLNHLLNYSLCIDLIHQ